MMMMTSDDKMDMAKAHGWVVVVVVVLGIGGEVVMMRKMEE